MSDGLKLVSSIIANGAVGELLRLQRDELIENEVAAFDFVRGYFRTYRELPAGSTVQEETGIRLPQATEPMRYYLDRVSERYDYNLIRDRFSPLREALAERNMQGVTESVSSMSRVLTRRRRDGPQAGQVIDIGAAMRQVTNRLSRIRGTGGISGVTTDWPSFDTITGGYQDADLVTWVGRMGLGKTYVLLRQAQRAHADGETVLFVTTEMSIEQMARRYAALHLGIDPRLLRNGTISTYTERRIASLVTGIGGSERFKLFSVGMNSAVSAIEALCQEFGPTAVYVDGVYLLRPTNVGKGMSRTDKVAGVYDELKGLTLEVDRPFICTTQFNRAAGKGGKEGTLETIGFSDAIGTHSSVVVALKNGTSPDPRDSRTFDFLKGREGESGEVEINFKFAPLDMDERTPDERTSDDDGESGSPSVEWMIPRRRAA